MLNLRLMDYLHGVYLLERELKPSTILQYGIDIGHYSRWLGRSATLGDLQPDTVSAWLTDFHEGRNAISVNKARRSILVLWHHAYDNRVIEQDTRAVRRFRQRLPIPEAWTADELTRLVDACYSLTGFYKTGIRRATTWELLIRLAYDTGGGTSTANVSGSAASVGWPQSAC